MSDDLTPRDVIAEFVIDVTQQLDYSGDRADKLLAALDAAGWSITKRASTRAYWEAKAVALETELHNLTRNVAAVAAEMNRCADPGVALYYGTKIVAAIEGEVVPDVE